MTKNNNHSRFLFKHGLNDYLIVLYAVSCFCFAMDDAHALDSSATSTDSSAFFEEGTALYWKSFSNQDGSMHTLYNNDGSVGIGTSEVTTGYKLDVNGKVGMEGLDARSNLTVGAYLNCGKH